MTVDLQYLRRGVYPKTPTIENLSSVLPSINSSTHSKRLGPKSCPVSCTILTAMDGTTDQRPIKKSRGRQKIEIKKVEKENSRYVTFSKRKNGIFKKATELSTLCGADVAVILFSEHGKVFSCGNPNVEKVLDRYLAEKEEKSCILEIGSNGSGVTQTTLQERDYKKSLSRLEEMKRAFTMISKNSNMNKGEFWWDLPIDNMEKEELESYRESLEELKKNVMTRIEGMAAHNAAGESSIINQFINHNGVWNNSIVTYDAGLNNGFL
ncbi:agamous-like MADS-box protein AGL61 [Hevea brasiliensis]|nr:agamous-like MADS-box protein AGL61 [Hevea brasiliensis]